MTNNEDISNLSNDHDHTDFTIELNNVVCENCECEHHLSYKFCPHCGQHANNKLTVGELFYNTIANYFSFDARFFRSFVPLVFQPGLLAKRFVGGKRLMYLHPAQMYLFISVVFFFLFSFKVSEYNINFNKTLKKGFQMEKSPDPVSANLIDSMQIIKLNQSFNLHTTYSELNSEKIYTRDSVLKLTPKPENIKNNFFGFDRVKLDSLISIDAPEKEQFKAMGMDNQAGFIKKSLYKQLIKFYKNKGGGIIQGIFDSIPISLFILLPIFAMILKIFFWRRATFAHHLVFSFYYFSFLFVVLCILIGVNYLINIPDWIDILILMSTFLYLVLAISTFYEQGIVRSFVKASFSSFVYMLFVLPIAVFIMLGFAFIFY